MILIFKDFLLGLIYLNPWSRVILEKLVAPKIVKNLVTFNWT